jgi:hypothetical protein
MVGWTIVLFDAAFESVGFRRQAIKVDTCYICRVMPWKLPKSAIQATALSILFAAFVMIFGIACETFTEDSLGIGPLGECAVLGRACAILC